MKGKGSIFALTKKNYVKNSFDVNTNLMGNGGRKFSFFQPISPMKFTNITNFSTFHSNSTKKSNFTYNFTKNNVISLSNLPPKYFSTLNEKKESERLIKEAISYEKAGKLEEALKSYENASQLDPLSDIPHYKRYSIFSHQQKINNAFEEINKAINLSPTNDNYYYERSSLSIIQNDIENSLKDISKAIEINDKRGKYFYMRSYIYRISKNFPKAIEDLSKSIEFKENLSILYNQRAQCYKQIGNLPNAILDFTYAIENYNLDEESEPEGNYYYFRGGCYANNEQLDKALIDYSKAIELMPDCALFYFSRASSYYRLGKLKKALEDFQKSIDLEDDKNDFRNGDAHFMLSSIYFDIKEFQSAINELENAIKINPSRFDYFHFKGKIHAKLAENSNSKEEFMNENNLAIENLTKSIELNENFDDNFHLRGICFERLGKYEKALNDFSSAIQLSPAATSLYLRDRLNEDDDEKEERKKLMTNYLQRSINYFSTNQFNLALEDINIAIQLNSEVPQFYYIRADIYHQLNKNDLAILDLTKCIKIAPNVDDAYLLRGRIYFYNLGDLEKAELDFSKVIEISPDRFEPYRFRSRIYCEQKKYDLALDDALKSIERYENDDLSHVMIGWIYYEQKDFDKAFDHYTQAINISSNEDPQRFYLRGLVYHHRGECEKAIDDFTQSLALNPDQDHVYIKRGSCYYKQGPKSFKLAEEDFTKAIKMNASKYDAYFCRSLLNYDLKLFSQAEKDIQSSVDCLIKENINVNSSLLAHLQKVQQLIRNRTLHDSPPN